MRWLLFVLSLFFLYVATNVLFFLPGKYDWFNFTAAGVSVSFAAVCAWFSSKQFIKATPGASASWKSIMMAPPAVIWLFVVFLFCLFGLLRMIAG